MVTTKSPNIAQTKYAHFCLLYKKFVAGGKWLDERIKSGINVQKDTDEFVDNVIWPLHCLWESFSEQERQTLESVMQAYDKFGGKKLVFKNG